MLILKFWYHIVCIIQSFFFKILYGNQFKVGKKVTWRSNFTVMLDRNGKIEIGDNCFFNNGCSLAANQSIKIGDGTLFGENVKIYDHNHRFNNFIKPIKEQGFSNGEVVIGNHCWIGSNVVLLKGTSIGDNCVIGAGCIIDCMVPSETIVKQNQKLSILSIQNK